MQCLIVNNYVCLIKDLFICNFCQTAGLLTRYLITQSSFLHGVSDEQQLQIGGALLRHICQLVCNAHAITDVVPGKLGE